MLFIYYELIIFSLALSCHSYPKDIIKIVGRKYDLITKPVGKSPLLTHVICLGSRGETIEAVCCTPGITKSWLVILPTSKKIPCFVPDCAKVCSNVVSTFRGKVTLPDHEDFTESVYGSTSVQSEEPSSNNDYDSSTESNGISCSLEDDIDLNKNDGNACNQPSDEVKSQYKRIKNKITCFDLSKSLAGEEKVCTINKPLAELDKEFTISKPLAELDKEFTISKPLTEEDMECTKPPEDKDHCTIIKVPKIILELAQLCKNMRCSNKNKFKELKCLCNRVRDIPIEVFLENFQHYKLEPRQTTGCSSIQTEDDEQDETEECTHECGGHTEKKCSHEFDDVLFDEQIKCITAAFDIGNNNNLSQCRSSTAQCTESTSSTTVSSTSTTHVKITRKSTQPHTTVSRKTTKLNFKYFSKSTEETPYFSTTKSDLKSSFKSNEKSYSETTKSAKHSESVSLNVRSNEESYSKPIKNSDETTELTETVSLSSYLATDDPCCCRCRKPKYKPNMAKHISSIGNDRFSQLLLSVLAFPKVCERRPILPSKKEVEGRLVLDEDSSELYLALPKFKGVESVEQYVSDLNKQYMQVYSHYKQAAWDYETNLTHYTKQIVMKAALELSNFQSSLKSQLYLLTNVTIDDPSLFREVKLFYIQSMSIPTGLHWNKFEQVLHGMHSIFTSTMVKKWNETKEKVALVPEITDVMASSKNPEELKYYWSEWRRATGRQIRPLFDQYVALMSQNAKQNGFHDASEILLARFEAEDFMDSLSTHWEEIKPLYLELHAYVRHHLHQLYGNINGALDTGRIPTHLTGDIWGQNWKYLHKIVSPFKTDSTLHKLIEAKLTKKMTPLEMAKFTEKMFESIGFGKFSDKFWKESIFEKKSDTLMNCESSSWDMCNGRDFRIKLCCESRTEDIEKMLHHMAICEYYKEYSSLPFIFRDGANPSFHEGIAGAFELTSKFNNRLIRAPSSEHNQDYEVNELLRQALEKIVFLPYGYIVELWRVKVFRGEIDSSNYNTKWWELRSRYQGVKPHNERTEEDFDIGSKLHIGTNKPYIKFFVSNILEYQFFEALCKRANYTGPIHRCDFTKSTEAGRVLRTVMGMGASQHWKYAMEELTGVRRLDSAPLIRYFQPLYKWLKEKNKENKATIGWDE